LNTPGNRGALLETLVNLEQDAKAGTKNDEEMIFAAASFSKPVFAYLVMLLAEEGGC
jgi:CubicO group peptidase (beta-lactamase class C family)